MLTPEDAESKDTTTANSTSSLSSIANPSVPPSDGTCHFMRLPTELRLFIVENILEDFFASLTFGLYPPCPEILWFQLPYIKELYSVLHVSRALRAKSLDLCIKLAMNSSEEVLSHPPSSSIADRYHRRTIGSFPHALLKLKHKRILEILQQAKMSAGDAG